MAEVLFDVKQGRRTYTANAALTTGMLVIPGSTADQVGPAAATGPICMVALTDAASSALVEVMPVTRGAEYRLLSSGNIAAGEEVEFSTTTGKVKVYASGTKVGRAQEAAAANGLVRVIVY
jgi:predicted ATPase